MDVQPESVRGKNRQAYLWQYSQPGGVVVFDFRTGRERKGPKRFLGDFEGILQSDGYAAYDHVGGPNIVHAACWALARRKFFQAVEFNPKDQSAIRIGSARLRPALGSPQTNRQYPSRSRPALTVC